MTTDLQCEGCLRVMDDPACDHRNLCGECLCDNPGWCPECSAELARDHFDDQAMQARRDEL